MNTDYAMSIVIWHNARSMTQEEFTRWFTAKQEQPHTESEDELWDEAVKAILKHYPDGKDELKKQFTIKRRDKP